MSKYLITYKLAKLSVCIIIIIIIIISNFMYLFSQEF